MSSFLDAGSAASLAWAAYVVLGTLALLVAGVRILRALARRHAGDDPAAGRKAGAAVLAALLLGGGGAWALASFEAGAERGIHQTFTMALNRTLGESDYQEASAIAPRKAEALPRLEARLEEARVANDTDPSEANARNVTALQEAVDQTVKDLHAAQIKVRLLTPNHQVWLKVQPLLAAGRDGEARAILDDAMSADTVTRELPLEVACRRDSEGRCLLPLQAAPIRHVSKDSHQNDVALEDGVPLAYGQKEHARQQMATFLRFLAYPGVTGLFVAPFAFAGGSILARAFAPSDSVGFKPYPGKSAGWFLLLGAFGVFAIPFSAWVLRDLSRRSAEGQIAL